MKDDFDFSHWAALHEPQTLASSPQVGKRERVWDEHDLRAAELTAHFVPLHRMRFFDFLQTADRQAGAPARLVKPYTTPVAYTDWGPREAPIVVCVGGVANTAMRFAFLAAELCASHRVICMDWVGRGCSGWLADDLEYRLETYVSQLRQLVEHLGGRPVAIAGSSMGGSVAMEFAARCPALVERLVLNDIGAHMPQERRVRRAETLARFYVFRNPDELLRKVGAAQKNDGIVSADVRLFIGHHQTRWSPENAGRIYRADPRAMLAYQREAQADVDQWEAWGEVRCPTLLLHGMESDALSTATIARMDRMHPMTVAHIPKTGHTPVLCDGHQTHCIGDWLRGNGETRPAFSIPLAAPTAF